MNNPFDKVIEESQEQELFNKEPSGNPFDSVIKNEVSNNKHVNNMANIEGLKKVPTRQAQVNKLSREMKLPSSYVDRNYDNIIKDNKKRKLESLHSKNPFSKVLKNPDNIAVIQDDVDSVEKVSILGGRFKIVHDEKPDLLDDIQKGIGTNKRQLLSGLAAYRYVMQMGNDDELLDDIVNTENELIKRSQNEPEYYKKFNKKMNKEMDELDKSFVSLLGEAERFQSDRIANSLGRISSKGIEAFGEFYDVVSEGLTSPKAMTYQASQSLLNSFIPIAVGLPVSMAAGAKGAAIGARVGSVLGPKGAAVGGAIGGAAPFFAASTATGTSLEFMLEFKGILQNDFGVDFSNRESLQKIRNNPEILKIAKEKALKKSITTASVESLVTILGGKLIGKSGKGFASKAKAVAKAQGLDVAGEGIGEFAGQVAREGSLKAASVGESVNEALSSIFSGGAMSSVAYSVSKTENATRKIRESLSNNTRVAAQQVKNLYDKVKEGKQFQEEVVALNEAVQESNVNAVDAAIMNEFIAESTNSAGLFFQADEFVDHWKSLGQDPVEKADELLPGGRADLNKAQESGELIEVPIADFVQKFSNEESFSRLTEIIHKSPESMNSVQAESIGANIPSLLKSLAKEVRNEQRKLNERVNSEETIKNDIAGQFESIGYSIDESKRIAELYVAKTVQDAEVNNEDPVKTLRRKYLQINRRASVQREAIEGKQEDVKILDDEGNEVTTRESRKLDREKKLFQEDKSDTNKQLLAKANRDHFGFYTLLEEELIKKDGKLSDFNKMPASNLLSRIKKLPGRKKDELDFSGIELYLQEKGNEKVTKKEVIDFLAENRIEVSQFILSDSFEGSSIGDIQFTEEVQTLREYDQYGYDDILDEETRYNLEEDSWFMDEQAPEIEEELRQSYEDDNTEINEEEFKEELNQKLYDEAEKYAIESLDSEDNSWSRIRYYNDEYGIEFFYHESGGEFYYGSSYQDTLDASNENEAKIKAIAMAIEKGDIDADEAGFNLEKLYTRDTLNYTRERYVQPSHQLKAAKIKKIIKNEYEEIKAQKLEEDKKYWKDYEGSEEEAAEELERDIKSDAEDRFFERYENQEYKPVTVMFNVDNFDVTVNGFYGFNDGQFLKLTGDERIDGVEFQAKNFKEAQNKIADILERENIISTKEESDKSVFDPIGKAKFETYLLKGGTNYKETLVTLPGIKGKFTYAPHFGNLENIVVHILSKDRTNDAGEKILHVDELQSDWHQSGRKDGYELTPEERKPVVDAITKLEEEIETIRDSKEYKKALVDFDVEQRKLEEIQQKAYSDKEDLDKNLRDMNRDLRAFEIEDLQEDPKYIKLKEERDVLAKRYIELTGIYQAAKDNSTNNNKENGDTIRREKFGITEKNNEIKGLRRKLDARIPIAPFKDTDAWIMLGMKRVLKMAIDGGYDKISWSPGNVHKERWNTFNYISELKYQKQENGKYLLEYTDRDTSKEGSQIVAENELGNYVGEQVARAIKNDVGDELNGFKLLTGQSVKLDDQSLSNTYNKKIPKLLQKYVSKFDGSIKVKPDSIHLEELDTELEIFSDEDQLRLDDRNDLRLMLRGEKRTLNREARKLDANSDQYKEIVKRQEEIEDKIEAINQEIDSIKPIRTESIRKMDMLTIEITDKLREEISGGQLLFQDKDKTPRGYLDISNEDKLILTILAGANKSTALHELGHAFLETTKVTHNLFKDSKDLTIKQIRYNKMVQGILDHFNLNSLDKIETKHHEEFARLFEAYLMEGKAPSKKLRSAFNSFKTWLMNIYKSIAGISRDAGTEIELSDEMREVFNRMLASDEEIAEVNNSMAYSNSEDEDLLKLLKDIGASDAEIERLTGAYEEATSEAELALYKKQLAQMRQKQEKPYKARKKELIEKYKDIVDSTEVFIAIDAIKKNEINGEESIVNLKFNTEDLKFYLSKEEFADFPKALYSAKGSPVDLVSNILNYESPLALLEDIGNNPTKEVFINNSVTAELSQEFPDFMNPNMQDEMKVDAINAVHNDKRSQALALELELMFKNSPGVVKNMIRKIVRKLPTSSEIRDKAKSELDKVEVRNAKPYKFRRVENSERKQSGIYLAKGDFEKAIKAKLKESLNYEMHVASNDFLESSTKRLKKIKELFKKTDTDLAKKGQLDMFRAAQSIMNRFGMLNDKQIDKLEVYMAQLKAYDPQTAEKVATLSESLLQIEDKNYKELKVSEYNDVLDIIESLIGLAKEEVSLTIEGQKISRDNAVEILEQQLASVNDDTLQKQDTAWKKFKGFVSSAKANMTRMEHLINLLDNGDINGPFRKFLWQPALDAQLDYNKTKEEQFEKLNVIIEKYFKDVFQDQTKINISKYFNVSGELAIIRKSELIMAILHSGNESNKRKLLLGRNWGYENNDGSLNSETYDRFLSDMIDQGILTKDDFDGAQEIWDLLEGFKPEVQKVYKKIYGSFFGEIKAKEIVTPFGSYRGGYIPAMTDPLLVESSASRLDQLSMEQKENQFAFAATPKGFTKERLKQYNAALSLDFQIIRGHVEKTVRFAKLQGAVTDIQKLLKHQIFKDVLYRKNKNWSNGVFIPWLSRLATQQIERPADTPAGRQLATTIRYLRKNSNQQLMFANMVNTLENTTEITPLFNDMKPQSFAGGLKRYVSSPKELTAMVSELSIEMKDRLDNQIFDINDTYQKLALPDNTVLGKFSSFREDIAKHTYITQRAVQNVVEISAWAGAYDEQISIHGNSDKAVRFADSMIRRNMGSNRPIDMASIETGNSIQRVLLTFYGYFLNKANAIMNAPAGTKLKVVSLNLLAPAFLSALLRKTISGGWDGEDELGYLDDAFDVTVMSQVRYAGAMLPFGGPLLRLTEGQFTKARYDDRLSVSPLVSMLESSRGIKNILTKDELKGRDIRDTMNFFGTITGLPLGPLARPIGFLVDVESGKQIAETPIDYTRGIFTGRSGKK